MTEEQKQATLAWMKEYDIVLFARGITLHHKAGYMAASAISDPGAPAFLTKMTFESRVEEFEGLIQDFLKRS